MEVSAFGESAGQSFFTDFAQSGRYTFDYQIGDADGATEIVPTSSFYMSENAIAPTNTDTIGYQLMASWSQVGTYGDFVMLQSR